jgi:hypothetical protein
MDGHNFGIDMNPTIDVDDDSVLLPCSLLHSLSSTSLLTRMIL